MRMEPVDQTLRFTQQSVAKEREHTAFGLTDSGRTWNRAKKPSGTTVLGGGEGVGRGRGSMSIKMTLVGWKAEVVVEVERNGEVEVEVEAERNTSK